MNPRPRLTRRALDFHTINTVVLWVDRTTVAAAAVVFTLIPREQTAPLLLLIPELKAAGL